MPEIVSRQPRWLDYETPGYNFFQSDDKLKTRVANEVHPNGPVRKIAHRGTELFAVVGNELRWTDVRILKDGGDVNSLGQRGLSGSRNSYGEQKQKYVVLKVPVVRPIEQLSISPSGDFIAILTSHTCHVCILPSRRHLTFHTLEPIRLPSFQVGPTAHVLEQAPLVTALWHPLSPGGNGLITITKDACVRLWEVDSKNRSTFDEPTLAVDLKKLANATSVREDFSASRYGVNKGFSPDDVEMQVAAACFGGQGKEDEDGWSSMTLWVAMCEGDVYALCPFLPSKFSASATLLPSLSTSVVAKNRVFSQDQFVSETEKRVADQQCKWLADLDAQEPLAVTTSKGDLEIYTRPERLGAIPKLQGPFQLWPEPDFGEITDIHVIAPKINDEALFDDDQDLTLDLSEGLSIGVVCLATNTSKIHICLNAEGVEAEWLPSKRSRAQLLDDVTDERDLILYETVDLARHDKNLGADWWPTFTASPIDRYQIFSTQPTGVYVLSIRPWIERLEDELAASPTGIEGVEFRLNMTLDATRTEVEAVTSEFSGPLRGVNAAVAIWDNMDSEIGFIVLTSALHVPFATIYNLPSNANPFAPDNVASAGLLPVPEPRAPYQPDRIFTTPTALPSQLETLLRQSTAANVVDPKQPISFNPATFKKLTDAHRLIATETHRFGLAVGELFRQVERMDSELRAELSRAATLAHRVDVVTGENEFPDPVPDDQPPPVRGGRNKISERVADSRALTSALLERVDRLRAKLRHPALNRGVQLSRREEAFKAEVGKLAKGLLSNQAEKKKDEYDTETKDGDMSFVKMGESGLTTSTVSNLSLDDVDNNHRQEQEEDGDDDDDDGAVFSLTKRFTDVKALFETLKSQADGVVAEKGPKFAENETPASSFFANSQSGANNDYRRQALTRVYEMLERETAMLDAVGERLERLRFHSSAAR